MLSSPVHANGYCNCGRAHYLLKTVSKERIALSEELVLLPSAPTRHKAAHKSL